MLCEVPQTRARGALFWKIVVAALTAGAQKICRQPSLRWTATTYRAADGPHSSPSVCRTTTVCSSWQAVL